MEISIELKPLLGKAELHAEEYHNLAVGDVIVLDQKAEESLNVVIEDDLVLKATPGLFHNHKALQIDG
ncbi:MAG: FliM/FliN family flagellar motor switch protein [Chlamydiae bacterium]|nr:hypothetical protein [Chlamydiales bacterium]MCH9703982.1 FliM/FliN family flagellar motor switch protein [Chlamydiota bacterium]